MLCESVEPPLLLRQHGTLDLAQLYAAEVREIRARGAWHDLDPTESVDSGRGFMPLSAEVHGLVAWIPAGIRGSP